VRIASAVMKSHLDSTMQGVLSRKGPQVIETVRKNSTPPRFLKRIAPKNQHQTIDLGPNLGPGAAKTVVVMARRYGPDAGISCG
jgi:hypothetical protein